jgi:hypothetical protein
MGHDSERMPLANQVCGDPKPHEPHADQSEVCLHMRSVNNRQGYNELAIRRFSEFLALS